ncbi:MAG: zinc ribbon domain-containing protein [Candidatus Thermoplasmatota archaeon]|nr:zinc ribbon domain-containing protein [Candidatus Thermoplasmatota archaeon]MCL5984847.1 zinc ribbon domain-containing protein [Candidatus Thermoplasmatota archaeon]
MRGAIILRDCPSCGAENNDSDLFCQRCGRTLPRVEPLPSEEALRSSEPRRRVAKPRLIPLYQNVTRRGSYSFAVALLVLVAILLALFFLLPPNLLYPPQVKVTNIVIQSRDNVCGINGLSGAGFTTSAGGSVSASMTLYDLNTSAPSCTVRSVSALTPGFSVWGTSVPLTVPLGTSESLTFHINVPDHGYTGVLDLDFE